MKDDCLNTKSNDNEEKKYERLCTRIKLSLPENNSAFHAISNSCVESIINSENIIFPLNNFSTILKENNASDKEPKNNELLSENIDKKTKNKDSKSNNFSFNPNSEDQKNFKKNFDDDNIVNLKKVCINNSNSHSLNDKSNSYFKDKTNLLQSKNLNTVFSKDGENSNKKYNFNNTQPMNQTFSLSRYNSKDFKKLASQIALNYRSPSPMKTNFRHLNSNKNFSPSFRY